MITLERHEATTILKMSRATTNAIDLEMVHAFDSALDSAIDDDSTSLVLSSDNNKFFAIGFNLPHLLRLDRSDLRLFYRGFDDLCIRLLTCPKPIVAAISGHATAGGCILALACDRRIIAEGRRLMGLNEIHLALPVPYLAVLILRDLVGPSVTRRIVESGEFVRPEDALGLGIVDEIVPSERVVGRAAEVSTAIAAHPGDGWRAIRADRVSPILREYEEVREEKENQFVGCWFTDDARRELEKAAERF